jgi:uncharacterized membrane protein YoaK (UPF0700 family)
MHTLNRYTYILAVCLSALAGCVDAIGFLHLGGYFISFMSGNSTRFAVNLADGHMPAILLLGKILALFVAGTMLGVLVRHFSKPYLSGMVAVLVCVTALLAAAAFSHRAGLDMLAIACMTLAMGAENAVLQRNGDVVIGLTYMTGTLVKIGQRLADVLLGGARFAWLPYVILWLGLLLGGITGTVLFSLFGLQSIWIAVLWSASLTLAAILLQHRLAV